VNAFDRYRETVSEDEWQEIGRRVAQLARGMKASGTRPAPDALVYALMTVAGILSSATPDPQGDCETATLVAAAWIALTVSESGGAAIATRCRGARNRPCRHSLATLPRFRVR
jgi:hypothetical protein